jgi:hypothetical protein
MYFKDNNIIVLTLLSIVFFFVYSYLSYPFVLQKNVDTGKPIHLIYNQPDEGVNYLFIRHFVETGDFVIPEGLAFLSSNQVHPRSTTVVHRSLAPIGLPGFIVLVGSIAKICVFFFGVGVMNIVINSIVPLAAIAVPWVLYRMFIPIFGRNIACLSAILAFISPPWWYYAIRTMQHNTLFVFAMVLSIYFGTCLFASKKKLSDNKQYIYSSLTGMAFGLAIYIRPVEIIWMSLLFILLGVFVKKKISYKHIIFFLLGGSVFGILFFYTQKVFYDSYIGTGYAVPTTDGSAGTVIDGLQGIGIIKSLFFPFGIDIVQMLRVMYVYGLKLQVWFGLFGAIGFISMIIARIKGKISTTDWKYVLVFSSISLYIIAVYGSWKFADNLAGVPSFAVSYTRYFLPIFVFATPFIAKAISMLYSYKKLGRKFVISVMVFLFLFSSSIVFTRFEGLAMVKRNVVNYYQEKQVVLQVIPSDAVVITRYADKYIFPERKVITGFEEVYYQDAISQLLDVGIPVYLYDIALNKEEESEFNNFLEKNNIILGTVLYKNNDIELKELIKK